MSDVANKLRAAKALIEKGWTQGNYQDECGVCAYGAMQFAATGDADNEDDPRTKPLENILRSAIGDWWIARWNDAPERTQAEVLAAFDKAIILAEQSA